MTSAAQSHSAASSAPAITAEPFERIGRIVAVTGGHAVILLDSPEGIQIGGLRGPEIGTLLKAESGTGIALALVSALTSPTPAPGTMDKEVRIVEVEFIGELIEAIPGTPRVFRRGISHYPSLGDPVFRATRDELALAYAVDSETAIQVGHIQQDASIPAMIKIDDMLGKHFAILGTTGTGKSCAVALILRRILAKNPQAHVLLLDVHREYAPSFQGMAEIIKPDNMSLPFWLLNFDEAVEILVGQHAHRETDVEVLRELIPLAKARFMANQRRDRSPLARSKEGSIEAAAIGVDTPIPYRTSDLLGVIEDHIGKLELRHDLAPYKRLKARLESVTRDPRYSFMFGSLTVQDNMVQVLARLFRIPVNGKPVAILELGGLPSEIINVVVSVLARLAFDFGVWSAGRIPITFICEEAHRYVPNDKTLGFEPTKRAISKIAKEGRKYGVSLAIITQRPAELDPTILSQCNTIFSLRLTNERDQEILRAGIADTAQSLLDFMTTMGTGEAITFGEGVTLPTRIKFDILPPNELPRSSTASFTKNWSKDLPDDTFLHEIVARWRAQTYNPDSTSYSLDSTLTEQAAPQDAQPRQQAQGTSRLRAAPEMPQVQPAPGYAPAGLAPAPQQQSIMAGFNNPSPAPQPYVAPPPPSFPAASSFQQPQETAPAWGSAPAAPMPPAPPPAGSASSFSSLLKQFRT